MASRNYYNSRYVAALFDITTETVRVWAEEFTQYVSPSATPGKGRHRSFAPEDLEVFALIAELKGQGRTFQDIHAALANGQRGMPPDIEPNEVQAIVLNEQEKRLSVEVDYLKRTLMQVEKQRDDALQRLEEASTVKEQNIRLEVELENAKQRINEIKTEMDDFVRSRVQDVKDDFEARVRDLMTQLADAQSKIDQLSDERSRLERAVGESYVKGVMETLERKGDLPTRTSRDT